MKNRIITIGREFGSGGRTIGKDVAARLGIPCYDQEIILKLAEHSGFTPEYIQNESEEASHGFWSLGVLMTDQPWEIASNQDKLWSLQHDVITELGHKGSCVIVGRCADVILEDEADLLKVFIHADFEKRAKRIVEKYGETEVPTEKRLREKDKRRAMYYQLYTDRKWGAMENYHVILDSGVLGLKKCVDVIASLY